MDEQSPDLRDATRSIKEQAAKQKIELTLSQDQVEELLSQWRGGDPAAPAEITFQVKGKEHVNLKVAGYWYAGDTCCV